MAENTICIDVTGKISGTIEKDDGTALAGTAITTLTLTIRNRDAAKTVVNGRNESALSPPTTYVTEAGILTIPLLPADNVLIDSTKDRETHRIIIKWSYNAGADKGVAWADYIIQNPAVV